MGGHPERPARLIPPDPLDTARPGFAGLAPRLMPAAEGMGFVDSDSGIEPSRPHRHPEATAGRIEGDPHTVAARLREIQAAGVDELVITQVAVADAEAEEAALVDLLAREAARA